MCVKSSWMGSGTTFSPSASLSSGVGKRHPANELERERRKEREREVRPPSSPSPSPPTTTMLRGHEHESPSWPLSKDPHLPFGPRCQCTEDTVMKSSRPFNFLAMITRVACRSSITSQRTHPHTAHDPRVRQAGHKEAGEQQTYPGARVADVQMIPVLLGREPGAGLAGDALAERAHLPLELARLVVGVDPVGDFSAGGLCVRTSASPGAHLVPWWRAQVGVGPRAV